MIRTQRPSIDGAIAMIYGFDFTEHTDCWQFKWTTQSVKFIDYLTLNLASTIVYASYSFDSIAIAAIPMPFVY